MKYTTIPSTERISLKRQTPWPNGTHEFYNLELIQFPLWQQLKDSIYLRLYFLRNIRVTIIAALHSAYEAEEIVLRIEERTQINAHTKEENDG